MVGHDPHEWTHVGVQLDGTLETHFINGERSEYGSCPRDPAAGLVLNKAPHNHLRIGARGGYDCPEGETDMSNCVAAAANSQFKGVIDEVMVFSTPIAVDDVQYIFSAEYRSSGGHDPT